MAASPEYAQVHRTIAALRTVGLLWDSNSYEERLGDGVHMIDFKERRQEEVSPELDGLYRSIREAWKGVDSVEDFIRRDLHRQYTVKFLDSATASFQCTFEDGVLVKQRVSYQQSPFFRSFSGEELYECMDNASGIGLGAYWQLFGVQGPRVSELVSFRCDYDPASFKVRTHPRAHLHLGETEDCRICAESPVDAKAFFLFVVSHFYARKLAELEEVLSDWNGYSRFDTCIHEDETGLPFLSWGKA
jgi:hypothetical protein